MFFLARPCNHAQRTNRLGDSYRDLIAWQKAMSLVREIYRITKTFPRDEMYGLTNQLRRAAVSVPSNIAEGQARFSQKEFHHFLSLARGSLAEIETELLISQDLGYTSTEVSECVLLKAGELGRVLNGLLASVKEQSGLAVMRRGL